MSERRWTERRSSYLSGRIIFNQGYSSRDCSIRNFSGGGALVELENVAGVPEAFELVFLERGKRMPATRMWSNMRCIGLAFANDDQQPAEVVSLQIHARIRQLESENRALRARLGDDVDVDGDG